MLRVDVHNHFVPPEIITDVRLGEGIDGLRLERDGDQEWMVHRQGFRWPLQRVFHDLDARLEAMDAMGIDIAVMSIVPMLFMYWLDDRDAMNEHCRRANDAMAGFARASGGRIEAVATLPMSDPGAAVKELHRAVGELGLRGAEIGPRMEDTPLDDADLRPVLKAAADLDVPLILHPYSPGRRAGLEHFYLTNLIGNPLESTIGAAHLIFGGVLDELAGLRPVLMHGGGYLPYQIGRLDHGHRVRSESRGCRHAPSEYLTRFWYDTITHAPGPLEYLIGQVGADRVVYGTDFPFDMGGGPVKEQLEGVPLDGDSIARIAGGNAIDLFKLNGGGRS